MTLYRLSMPRRSGVPGAAIPAALNRGALNRGALICAALICGALAGPALADTGLPRTLSVTADGAVRLAPDVAIVSIGVSAGADTAGAALDQMSADMAQLLATLDGLGIGAADIQTELMLLEQQYSYDTPQPIATGFAATSALSVTVRDLDGVGALLDAAVTAGANRLNGISFSASDSRDALDEARRAAITEAARRAGVYAAAAGAELGPVVSISESLGGGGPIDAQMMRDVPVAPGSVLLTASVTVTYELIVE